MSDRRRALVAVLIGVAGAVVGVAGAGHAYLREWRRAAAWFSLVLGAALVLISTFADPATVTPSTLPTAAVAPILLLLTLSTLDAYRVANRGASSVAPGGADADDAPACPGCGRPVDPGIDFCWYCAEPVGREAEPEAEREGDGDGATAR